MDTQLAHFLATNTIHLRRSQGLTQSQLSKASGIPRSTINHIESGSGNPSLHNLARLAQSLNVRIEELIARPQAEIELIPANEISEKPKDRGRSKVIDLLPHSIAGIEVERLKMSPGSRFTGVPHLKGTKEYFTCLVGNCEITVAGEQFALNSGDVLVFPGDEKHAYYNKGQKTLLGISLVLLSPTS